MEDRLREDVINVPLREKGARIIKLYAYFVPLVKLSFSVR